MHIFSEGNGKIRAAVIPDLRSVESSAQIIVWRMSALSVRSHRVQCHSSQGWASILYQRLYYKTYHRQRLYSIKLYIVHDISSICKLYDTEMPIRHLNMFLIYIFFIHPAIYYTLFPPLWFLPLCSSLIYSGKFVTDLWRWRSVQCLSFEFIF